MSTTIGNTLPTNAPAAGTRGRPTRRRIGATLGVAATLIVMLAGAGAAYEMIAELGDRSLYAPAGQLVDIGGYRLHIDCQGEGNPTVVTDAGLGGSSLDWVLVQTDLAASTRVCVYDRAGMGWSDPSPRLPRSPSRIAEELHLLLKNADVPGPYVLVAHSLAGKNARMFALAHPQEVAGMVLVDTRSERIDAEASATDREAFVATLDAQAITYNMARRLGVARLLGASLVDEPLLPPSLATEMVLQQTQPAAIHETTMEGRERAADDLTLASSNLGSIPLVVIAAAESMDMIAGWPAAQQALADLSTKGRLVVAEHSGHAVQLNDPDLVVESVRSVLAIARQ